MCLIIRLVVLESGLKSIFAGLGDSDLNLKDSDLDLDLKALDLDLDSDLKVLTASPFSKSFVSLYLQNISLSGS